jgi:restriction system protein
MPALICPACTARQVVPDGAGAFNCVSCQRHVWAVQCRKCHSPHLFFTASSTAGSGTYQLKCPDCHAKTSCDKAYVRALLVEFRRLKQVEAAATRTATANQRMSKANHFAHQQISADNQTAELTTFTNELSSVLSSGLNNQPYGLGQLKLAGHPPPFSSDSIPREKAPPILETFLPPEPQGLASRLPSAKRKFDEAIQLGRQQFDKALREHSEHVATRHKLMAEAKAAYEQQVEVFQQNELERIGRVIDFDVRYKSGDPEAVSQYFLDALLASELPEGCPTERRISYAAESKRLVVEVQLPSWDLVPDVREYHYVKSRDEITAKPRPQTERKQIYTSLIAQLTLRVLHDIFIADNASVVETIILNGHVDTIDGRTGKATSPCLITVRTTKESFLNLNLAGVDPVACLKAMSASISKSPAELSPVRPILEFDMSDPRFVSEQDVLGSLDTRPNLMELSPGEFESLITNLFSKMGLETRLTQASRDGGVDCVAYDPRPILGGKVVVQAKRYKNTVGVSAVRDLYGTLQNEGASKGILVTTSGYGAASFEFANGKPIELLDGGNLLYLLEEHAGIQAKIEPPEDWVDPVDDIGE